MKTKWILLSSILFLFNSSAPARECKSCQEHRNGGSISYGNSYAPGGIYQSGGTYYPGGVYPGYNGYYGGNRYNRPYGSGTITQTCGAGSISGDNSRSGGGCVTRYRGPADDIQYLPRINRQIRQSYPRSFNNPWNRPAAVPLK
ncbi:MAG: hypothetical protein ACN4GR_11635 [Arenicellales bacterium]